MVCNLNNRISLSDYASAKLKMHSAFVGKKPNIIVEELIRDYLPEYKQIKKNKSGVNNLLTTESKRLDIHKKEKNSESVFNLQEN